MTSLYDDYFDELVELINQIPLNHEAWNHFAKRLNKILDTSFVQIQALDLTCQALSYSGGAGSITEEERANAEVMYLHYPVDADPRWAAFLNPERQGWYQCHTHVTDEFVAQSELYQNILLPINLRYLAAHELIWDDKLCVVLAIHTSIQRQPLNQNDLNFLDKLLIHLTRIVTIQRYLYEFSSGAIVGYALIDKLSQPIMLLNLAANIVHCNHSLNQLLRKTKLVNIQQNKIILPEPYHTQLQQNLQRIEYLYRHQQILSVNVIEDGCIKVITGFGETLYIFVTLLISEQEMKTFGIRPLVMLTFYHPDFTSNIDTHLLYTAFKLTPSECKVALLLMEGYVPKEIAKKHHVAIDTVRKQIQSIYKKTATHRQSDLVKLLLNIPKYSF